MTEGRGPRWFAQSAWSMAPVLFGIEALVLLLALVLVRGASLWLGGDAAEVTAFVVLVPGIGLSVYYFGKSCVLPPPQRVPRGRLIGTAFLIGALYAAFLFLAERMLFALYGDELREELPHTVITISDAQFLEAATYQGIWLAFLHMALLPLGVRAVERYYPPLPPPESDD